MFCEYIGNSKKTGAIGFDYGYYNDVPYSETQTYPELLEIAGAGDISNFFVSSLSPNGKEFYQDPTFYWYCDNFLNLAANSNRPLYNMTDAGLLYGQNIVECTIKGFFNG